MKKVDRSWVSRLDEVADGEGFSVPQGVPSVIRNGLVRPSLTPAGLFALRTGFAPSVEDLALLRSLAGAGVWGRQRWRFDAEGLVLEAPGSVVSRFRDCGLCGSGYRGSYAVERRATRRGLELAEELDDRFGPDWWREEGGRSPDRLEALRIGDAAIDGRRPAEELRDAGSGETADRTGARGNREDGAGDDGGRSKEEESNSGAAVPMTVERTGDRPGDFTANGGAGGAEGLPAFEDDRRHFMHGRRSLAVSAFAGIVLLAADFVEPGVMRSWQVIGGIGAYVAGLWLFFAMERRDYRKRRAAPTPDRFGGGRMALCFVAVVFFTAGGEETTGLAGWIAFAALVLGSMSDGAWVALVAECRGVGFWRAWVQLITGERVARRQYWTALFGEDGR
ncbi:MAG: hypothetical protein OXN81_13015 [Alphaproteobacteria bacterium]|nr:hypothetical protein [Alphaproteobacteria bacterium]